MKSCKRILVAYDMSEHAVAALEYAAQLAGYLKAALVIVNVINRRDIDAAINVAMYASQFTVEKFLEDRTSERERHMDDVLKKVSYATLHVTKVFKSGVPFEEVLTTVKEQNADLLVMGTRGRSNLARVFLGSTAEKVFRRCPVPLLSVRKKAEKRS